MLIVKKLLDLLTFLKIINFSYPLALIWVPIHITGLYFKASMVHISTPTPKFKDSDKITESTPTEVYLLRHHLRK